MKRRIEHETDALGGSLWTDTANPSPDTPRLAGNAETDVAVVGAGFTGLSCALHLAERGLAVTVLEARSPGWGASGRNGGQVIAGLKEDPDTIRRRLGDAAGRRAATFAGNAPGRVFDLIERHGIRCGAVRNGWIQPAYDAATDALLESRVAQWSTLTDEVELLDTGTTRELLGTDRYTTALIDRRCGGLHPLNYALGLADAAMQAGARIHGDSPVTDIHREGETWRLRTPDGTLSARQAVLATNAYSGPLNDRLRRSIIPACSAQVASAPLSQNVRRSILPDGQVASDTRKLLLYFRLDQDGRFLIGGRGAYDEKGVRRQQERLRRAAAELFPQVGAFDWRYAWGGLVALTYDHYPHLHELAPGLYAGLGYNGRGVAMATAMGCLLADITSGAPAETLDFPVTKLAPIPLHALRKIVVGAVSTYYAARDRA